MINLENQKLSVDGEIWLPITEWACWFMTPFGIVNNLTEAVKMCKRRDLDVDLIIPVTVAITSEPHIYEIVRR